MLIETAVSATLFIEQDMQAAELHEVATGAVAVYSVRCPGKETVNEDAAAIIPCDATRAVLAVADGFGGQPAGDQAARLAIASLVESVEAVLTTGGELRWGILNGFEQANRAVSELGVGAATTLVVAEIDGHHVRPYHVGDSELLVVGQRGKLKLQTVSHTPVSYAVDSGWLNETEALHHDERHLVSNVVGAADMRIEIGSSLRLAQRDTVLLASDGLFDNLHKNEITEGIRTGSLQGVADTLAKKCLQRMNTSNTNHPSKPDDLTFILYRLNTPC
jgi:serine/threonine protein phosphatase PrpC